MSAPNTTLVDMHGKTWPASLRNCWFHNYVCCVGAIADNPSDSVVSKLYNPSGVDVSYSTRHVEESWHHLMKSEDTAKFKQIAVCNFDFLLAAVSVIDGILSGLFWLLLVLWLRLQLNCCCSCYCFAMYMHHEHTERAIKSNQFISIWWVYSVNFSCIPKVRWQSINGLLRGFLSSKTRHVLGLCIEDNHFSQEWWTWY